MLHGMNHEYSDGSVRQGMVHVFRYAARDFFSRRMYRALERHCRGDVLDVGGWDFFLSAMRRNIPCRTWTTLEPESGRLPSIPDSRFRCVTGNGCAMDFADASFDTVLCIQVLEHVVEPLRMVSEIGRVLRKGGKAVFLVPQTSTMHMAPKHYYNFTRFWIEEAIRRAGLELVDLQPIGGRFSSTASHFVHFFFQSIRYPGMSVPACRRTVFFYLLYPFMALTAAVLIPVCLLFSLGDLQEEANNHLVVAMKGSPTAPE